MLLSVSPRFGSIVLLLAGCSCPGYGAEPGSAELGDRTLAAISGESLSIRKDASQGERQETLLSGIVLSEAVVPLATAKELQGRVWLLSGNSLDKLLGQQEDQLTLKNGEKLKGRVKSLAGGRVRINTSQGEDDFPIASVVEIRSNRIKSFTALIRSADWQELLGKCAADFRSKKSGVPPVYCLRPSNWKSLQLTLPFFALSSSPEPVTLSASSSDANGPPEEAPVTVSAAPPAGSNSAVAELSPSAGPDECTIAGVAFSTNAPLQPEKAKLITGSASGPPRDEYTTTPLLIESTPGDSPGSGNTSLDVTNAQQIDRAVSEDSYWSRYGF